MYGNGQRETDERSELEGDDSRPGACPVCEAEALVPLFELPSMPTVCNALFDSEADALAVPRGDLKLVFCSGCGHVHNAAFDPQRVPYGPSYENSLHFSPRFEAYADGLARRLVERYGIRNAQVLEIACGNGEFLARLCEVGANRGIGFDPSGVIERAPDYGRDRIEIVADYFRQEHAQLQASLIVCRHALEHIATPRVFVRMLRSGLEQRNGTVVYFEVPNGRWILDDNALWDLIYEHCGYFTRESLSRLFESEGFEILDVGEGFDRQFLWVEARPASKPVVARPDLRTLGSGVARFARSCEQRIERWRMHLESCAERGLRVGIWGAGSKGVTFLNLFRDTGAITHVIDVNPHKGGMYVSGTGHRIRPPHELAAGDGPDQLVVMNPAYLDEIRAQVASQGLAAACHVA